MFRESKGNNNHFEEHFEDSENEVSNPAFEGAGYSSELAPNQSLQGQQEQFPIQLLKMKPNREFEINRQAVDIINSYNKAVGIVCLAGKYRTGKSFLLNKLLNIKGQGFKVDNSTSACTEGIWMWSKPIYNPKQDCYLFFIDTEGSESTNRDSNHDSKIFTLAILMSSYFIYNSVGAIDQQSISQLNLVSTLSKRIAVSEESDQDSLHNYMPKFMWLLRDFVLEARNQNGQKLSPYQYLEDCLLEQNSQVKFGTASRNIRRAMTNLFRDRDCMMLVRPAMSEYELKDLGNLPEDRLRPEFMKGVDTLRQKILSGAGPKMIKGEPMNSIMLTQMMISYTDTINDDGIPNITSAWEHLGQQAALQAYDEAIEVYNDKYEEHFSVDEPKEDIHQTLKEIRDQTMDAYDCSLETPNERIRSKLKSLIAEKEKAIVKINDQLNEARSVEILKECSERLMRNVKLGKYSAENPKGLTEDLNSAINQYNQKATGSRKCEVLSMFLTNFNPMVIRSYTQTTRTKIASTMSQVGATQVQNQDNQELIQTLQQRIRSMETQIRSQSNVNVGNAQAEQVQSSLRQQNQKMRKQIEVLASKKTTQKCCLLF